ncbi:MAG: heme synthase [Bacteroidetes bacterium]|jgi:cytochrome c oxidase assembly protein subunit 15|nr:heme synthase [Bacteroidota bacterium]
MLKSNPHKGVILWLFSGCFLVYVMVVIGCLTRLTHSGLSINDWSVMGSLPPMNAESWNEHFSKYQQSPEFAKVNFDMKLDEFKHIFWWEYIHRMIGRFIGFVFIGGFAWFYFKKKIDKKLLVKLLILVGLGGLQGVIGWWMVKSGIQNKPAVSHYRLATHLMSAFTVFAFTFWYALELLNTESKTNETKVLKLRPWLITLFVVLVIQIIYGAFTAGYVEMGAENKPLFRPGQIFNTWPKMGDQWIAEQVTMKSSFFANYFENAAGIQFVHRTLAVIVVLLVAFVWNRSSKLSLNKSQYRGITFLVYGITVQFILGVFTLIYHVPVILGVLHQSGAFFLFAVCVYLLFHFRKRREQVIA